MKFINLHTHDILERDNELSILNLFPEKAVETSSQQTERYYSVGLHPWHIDGPTVFSMIGKVEEWAIQPNVIAIGEIGLDRKCQVNFSLQEEVVLLQLKIAEKLSKPVIWHVVKAYSDLLLLKKKLNPLVPWILHGYNAKEEMTASLVKQGFYFSFGPMLMDEASKNAEMLSSVPWDMLFIENDESGIPIHDLYEKAASVLSLSSEQLKQIVNDNFLLVFGKRE